LFGLAVAVPCWAQSGAVHVVRSGDSLWKLQEHYKVPWKRIKQANGLPNTVIRVGQRLRIPGVSAPSTAPASYSTGTSSTYTASTSSAPSSGGSFSASGSFTNTTVAKDALRRGLSKLIQERTANPVGAPQTTQIYRVRSGDSLGRISQRYGVSLSTLRSMNGIPSSSSLITVGQRLKINRAGHPRRLSIRYHDPMAASNAELTVIARIIKGECPHFMSFEGKVSVAAVLLNRVRRSEFPFSLDRSITKAAHRPAQFSCYNSDKRDQLYYGAVPTWAYEAARTALAGVDPTQGATHYFNPYLVSPGWSKKLNAVVQLGRSANDTHLFYRTKSNVLAGSSKPDWAY